MTPLPTFWQHVPLDTIPDHLSTAFENLATLLWQIDDIGRSAQGYNRLAWTHEEAQLRLWFAMTMQQRGFQVEVDSAGNQWAWLGDPSRSNPGMSVGSHLDSVPNGGPFDGPLGVLSAIAAYDMLHAQGWQPESPLGIANFHDEEGARFAIACFGSRSLTGVLSPQDALNRRDSSGVSYAQALEAFRTILTQAKGEAPTLRALHEFDEHELALAYTSSTPPTPESLASNHAYMLRSAAHIELHIEQGCTQNEQDAPVAVADGIWPHGRWRVDIKGIANHAGCSPIAMRHDPTLGLAHFILAAREEAERHHSRTTVGRIQITPNGPNVIPSRATCWLDCRACEEQQVLGTIEGLQRRAECGEFESQISHSQHDFSMLRESWTPGTIFSVELQRLLTSTVGNAFKGLSAHTPIPVNGTAAGHDAGILSETGSSAGMLFVRNLTGASHTPAEYATPYDCALGIAAYAAAMQTVTHDIAQGWRAQHE
jgi:N-carbamoyl-L-amino-acid hydrolase